MRSITPLFISLLFSTLLVFLYGASQDPKNYPLKGVETIPLSVTKFKLKEKRGDRIVDLEGKDFVVVSVRERGSDGRFYAVDRDGTVWWSGVVTSGTLEHRTPSGIFPIIQKKRYHMSTLYPDESGVNNMDYMLKFTWKGHALHQGSVNWLSHGCIHIDPKDAPTLYHWATFKTKVVITRHSYMPFAQYDLVRIYKK
jgi:lipoprotein-anchoring transpeptidase ErfK/SrfK